MTGRRMGGHYPQAGTRPRLRRWALAAAMLTATGTVVHGEAGPALAGGRAAASVLRSPGAVAVAPDGTIYIADTTDSRVLAVGPNGAASVVKTSTLNKPLGVAVDGSGNLFIADTYNNRILEEPAGGGTERTVASGVNPQGIAVDKQNNEGVS